MRNNKAVSMISLIITILLMIIVASMSGYYLSSTIDDAQYKDAKESLKNVENVVEYAKTQILIDEFMPDTKFLITDSELDGKFGSILTTEEIAHIKATNADATKSPAEKFYLMSQVDFDEEFGNDYNVSDLRRVSEYLVNYMDTTVIANYGGKLLANKNIVPTTPLEKGEISLVFSPNGNTTWALSQATKVNVEKNSVIQINDMKYLWSRSYTEPAKSEFVNSLVEGQEITIDSETGNDWS